MSESVLVKKNINNEEISVFRHKHDFVEIAYTMKGKYTHIIDGHEYIARHGEMVIINYNQTHELKGTGVYINILLKPQYISQSLVDYENAFALLNLSEFEGFKETLDESKTLLSFSKTERAELEVIIEGIIKELNGKKTSQDLMVRSWFNLMLVMIFRKMSLDIDNETFDVSEKLLNYIKIHSHENITLSSVARMCSYNSSYFSRIFKEYTGKSFTEYFKCVRIEKAAELILSTSLTIEEIVYRTGYSDKSKFFSDFKKIKGMTPLQYRKSNN